MAAGCLWKNAGFGLVVPMKKILIIDDEPDVAAAMELIVEGAGYSTDVCLDPVFGLGIAGDYSLLLLDVMMPGLSGIDFLKRMKKAGLSVPVIIVSAILLPPKTRKDLESAYPPIGFVTKTHMNTDLIPAINKKLGR